MCHYQQLWLIGEGVKGENIADISTAHTLQSRNVNKAFLAKDNAEASDPNL